MYAYSYVADADDMIGCPSEYMGTVKDIVLCCAEVRDKALYSAIVKYATEDDYRAIYDELLAIHEWEEDKRNKAILSGGGVSEEEEENERQPYDFFASLIYDFNYAVTYVSRKPSDDLDIEYVKQAVLNMAFATGGRDGVEGLHRNYNDRDYRETYRELYVKFNNDIADIEEDIYLHDDVPYSIEMCDGHRVVCPHFEQIIEADEIKEAAFFDDNFGLILDEETGKVKMVADHYRLTEEGYEEMERLEADHNFHASLCEADALPF